MELETIVICSCREAIKLNGVYINLGKEIIGEYENEAYKQNKAVSHGLCPNCIDKYKQELAIYDLLEQTKRYFKNA